ncbi:MAG: glutamine amidotransferase [Rhodobacteraceae bacterium]|nr:glutamine amidotransferase [Paracoccaceae bacterium]
MKGRVILVRHGEDAVEDRVVTHLTQAGYTIETKQPYRGNTLEATGDYVVGAVVFGGDYNAYDTELHRFLKDEYRLINEMLTAEKRLLCICQGAQMIAHHLGAFAGAPDVEKHEFGLYEITPVDPTDGFMPGPLWLTQAHFHTFDLPDGATHLARSEMFEHQTFRLGEKVYGLQFHAEQTPEGFRRWQDDDHWIGRPGVQSREEQDRMVATHDAAQAAWFFGFLEKLFPGRTG